jgi:cell division transport system permease protein
MAFVVAALVTLAASSALASNAQVIEVLRLVGARDTYIARAFVRRFTLRAMLGALAGRSRGCSPSPLLPAAAQDGGGFLTGLGFPGRRMGSPARLPPLVGVVAFAATRAAAFRALEELHDGPVAPLARLQRLDVSRDGGARVAYLPYGRSSRARAPRACHAIAAG